MKWCRYTRWVDAGLRSGEKVRDCVFPFSLSAFTRVVGRLCDYEDTGFTPAEVVAMAEELRELKKEKDI